MTVRDGGTLATEHHVVDVRRDADGRVTGVVVETPDGTVEIEARRGVIVAAGGYEGSPERRAEHGTPGSAEWTMAPRGTNTGERDRGLREGGRGHRLLRRRAGSAPAWRTPTAAGRSPSASAAG